MPLSAEDRLSLVALLPELGPAGNRSTFVHAALELGDRALDEIGELPGLETLRAGLLRALPDLVEPEQIPELLKAAAQALATYPEMARTDDPMLTLARHPAWVGLAQLELSDREDRDGLERAITLARIGFEGTGGAAPGEVLWAMAEQAEEQGWTGRSAQLLRAAHEAKFDDEAHRGEVRLLLALRMAEDGDPGASDLLAAIAGSSGPTQRRVHAHWVLSAVVRQSDPQRAIQALSEALALLNADPDSDPGVVGRVREALSGLGAPIGDA